MTEERSRGVVRPDSAPSLPEKVIAIHERLAEARVPHAIGGALALAYYAEPRATIDVDINVFVSTDRWPDVRDALAPLGIDVDLDIAALERDGQARLWWDRNPVDLFFSYDPFHDEMKRRARRVPFGWTEDPDPRPRAPGSLQGDVRPDQGLARHRADPRRHQPPRPGRDRNLAAAHGRR